MEFIRLHQDALIIGVITSLIVAVIIAFISWMKKFPPIKVPLWVIVIFVSIPLIFFSIITFQGNEIVPVVDQKFESQRIILDGKKFIRCEFDRCVLVFNGRKNFGMEHCDFIAPKFEFGDYATITTFQIKKMLGDKTFAPMIKDLVGISPK